MDVLVVGGGGREAALVWKLARSPSTNQIWVTHDNPGFPASVRRLPDGEIPAQALVAGIELVVVGPEAPLAEGLVDDCRAIGVAAFGPTAAAAQLESSKGFSKDFMVRHGIPTAAYHRCETAEAAHAVIDGPCVVKADGLAAGKGVYVCGSADEAHEAVDALFSRHSAVVVEELLVGEEVSVLALTDGERFVLLPPAQDHKQRFDGDSGPNTGGMGAYAPAPIATDALLEQVCSQVIRKTVDGMAAEGTPFTGVVYAGIMVTADGPKVLEFNCRFGDPECQPLMLLLDEDLGRLLLDCATENLVERPLKLHDGAACCVVMVSDGYPGAYPKGATITGLDDVGDDVVVFQAGTRSSGDTLFTNGGRVLGVTGQGADIRSARDAAYAALESIHFEGAAWRSDIAGKALQ